jgi:enterochelin esterase family protein
LDDLRDDSFYSLLRLQNAVKTDNNKEVETKIENLKAAVVKSGTPLVNGERATFLVFPETISDAVSIKGIFSRDSGNVTLNLEEIGDFNVWSGSYPIPANAEFIYNIDIDGMVTEDPLCKRWLIGFGKHSVGRMPDFDPWVDRALSANPPQGKMVSFNVPPKKLKGIRKIQIYLPPGYTDSTQRYPVLYVHDGAQAIVDGKIPQIVDYLLADNQIKPIILCFVSPGDRMLEYGVEDNIYADFLVNEVVPQVDKRFRTKNTPLSRAVTGASMGGRISCYLVAHHSNVFQICISQSAYFEKNCAILENLQKSPQLPIQFYCDVGIFEQQVGGLDLLILNQEFRDLLKKKGYVVNYREWPGGHCWLTWSRGIGEALPIFWPRED